jgi:photosystem II stability/assembly factor-like uncharacterized protein
MLRRTTRLARLGRGPFPHCLTFCLFVVAAVAVWTGCSCAAEGSWQRLAGYPSECFLDIAAPAPERLVCTSWGGGVFLSRDRGQTWSKATISAGFEWLEALTFVDASAGWLAGSEGRLYRTADGGATWEQAYSAASPGFCDVSFLDVFRGWAVGLDGLVAVTRDGGKTWRKQRTEPPVLLKGVAALDEDTAILVGLRGNLFRSGKGGGSLERLLAPTQANLQAVAFRDAREGWAVGEGGTVLYTNDGGSRWVRQESGTTAALGALAVTEELVVTAGEGGTVLLSRDQGRTWLNLSLEKPHWIHALAVGEGRRLYAAGVRGTVWARYLPEKK